MTGLTNDAVTVRVPATSANLGAGYDSLGLALGLYDEVTAQTGAGTTEVHVEGEGAQGLPRDESHLVVTSLAATLWQAGVEPVPVTLHCRNAIPQARGLGSSSAAIVAGVLLAHHLMGREEPDRAAVLRSAAELEGHPDNVAACVLGGFTVAWTDESGAHAVSRAAAPGLRPVVYVPRGEGLTAHARAVLPDKVPHVDAAFNVARAALAVAAFTSDPGLLLDATADRLHQPYRAADMPATSELLSRLRAHEIPAMVSGAGPTVLAFCESPPQVAGFEARALAVSEGACRLR